MSSPPRTPTASSGRQAEPAAASVADRLPPLAERTAVVVRGARTHNLKSVDCRVPHEAVTVVTGVSGAGKSSLAFDTIYAEAQRRFVESLSTYVRQFLEQIERPPVEAVENVLPAVAIEARNAIRSARATVGTLTEVHDLLRLLYAHFGEVRCPHGHGPVAGHGPQALGSLLEERFAGQRVLLVAALERPERLANEKLAELVRQGYARRLVEDGESGEIERMAPSARWTKAMDPLLMALGRFRLRDGARARLVEAIEEGYLLTGGRLQVIDEAGATHFFGRALTCETCGERLERPTPPLFSFNSPLGACPTCQGFGRVLGIDPGRVVPDVSKSLEERPIAPWNSPAYEKHYPKLYQAARAAGVPTDVPWSEMTAKHRRFVWSGKAKGFVSLDRFFARLEKKTYKMHVRILLARYRAYDECPDCHGARLRPQALAVRVAGETIAELSSRSIEALRTWLDERTWSETQPPGAQSVETQSVETQSVETQSVRTQALEPQAVENLVRPLRARLETLHRVGLGYLSLDRQGRSLSGGETQRIQLAAALGSGLTGTLYVLDEPTIGLHPRDSDRLLALLRDLADHGNTVLVVEHDRTLMEGADWVIDLGPQAGEHGGRLMAQGPMASILEVSESRTAQALREPPPTPARFELEEEAAELLDAPRVTIRGARENNLRGFDVSFPRTALVAVTGVSGSGKSTLVHNVLHDSYQRSRGTVDVEPGEHDALEGLEELADIVLVDQRPLGRSSRSNPVTYIKAYDELRKLYAATPDAKRNGIAAGHFSFNLDRGRCPTCEGTGTQEIDMQFMAPVEVVCDTCNGRRFKPEILAIQLRGRSIDETLALTVDEAAEIFADRKALVRKLDSLRAVGLGYLHLGQSTATLSGGEAQRLKLASYLDKRSRSGPRLFLFDEPTTGLHLADIALLHKTLRRLVERGDGVVVVEHSPELIAEADWIVDLGPGGGSDGGELLFSGPLLDFLDRGEGPTAEVLRAHLRWERSAAS